MIDITEKFFTEIKNSKEVLYESYKFRENEPIKLTGRCAVIARKERKHIDKLERLIRNTGMKPIIFQSEDTRTFSKIEAKCRNLDILVFYQPDTYYHFASGDENQKKKKLLREKGIFISTRWSDKNLITPVQLLDKLFTYIRISEDFKHLHNLGISKPETDSSDIKYPEDISKKKEFFEMLQEYELNNNFNIQLTNVEPKKFHRESTDSLKVISKSEMQYIEVNNSSYQGISNEVRTVRFSFVSDKKFDQSIIEKIEDRVDDIYQKYNNFLYRSEIIISSFT